MNTKSKRAAVAGSGIVALALLGAAANAGSVRYAEIEALNTSLDDAAAIALTEVAGDIIEAELEVERQRSVWEIEIVNDANQVVCIEVDGQTGEILRTESSDDDVPMLGDAVSLNKAIEIIRAVESGALVEMELDDDDGELVWEIEAVSTNNTEKEYRINGLTGEIL